MTIMKCYPNFSCDNRKQGLRLVLLSHKSTDGRGKLRLQYSHDITCMSELILISWNFMRPCYLWADAAPAPNRLNSSSCDRQRPNPQRRWSGFRGRFTGLCAGHSDPTDLPDQDDRSCLISSVDAGLCTILFTSLWWQVFQFLSAKCERCDMCVSAWISYSVVLLRVWMCQYKIWGCQLVEACATLSTWSWEMLKQSA